MFPVVVAVVLTSQHYFPPIQGAYGLILQICRWNFNCIFRSFGDISISGFSFRSPFPIVGHYWNPLYTLNSCEFAVVECRRFVVGILMMCFIVSETQPTTSSQLHGCHPGFYTPVRVGNDCIQMFHTRDGRYRDIFENIGYFRYFHFTALDWVM